MTIMQLVGICIVASVCLSGNGVGVGVVGVAASKIGYITGTTTTDLWQSDLIASFGHVVTRIPSASLGGAAIHLSFSQIDQANSYDLLVLSRTIPPAFVGQTEWNTNVLRPILILNPQVPTQTGLSMLSSGPLATNLIGNITALNTSGLSTATHSLWYIPHRPFIIIPFHFTRSLLQHLPVMISVV
jgi:hypothetical protein